MVQGLEYLPYEESLSNAELCRLEERRLWRDITAVFLYLNCAMTGFANLFSSPIKLKPISLLIFRSNKSQRNKEILFHVRRNHLHKSLQLLNKTRHCILTSNEGKGGACLDQSLHNVKKRWKQRINKQGLSPNFSLTPNTEHQTKTP